MNPGGVGHQVGALGFFSGREMQYDARGKAVSSADLTYSGFMVRDTDANARLQGQGDVWPL